LHLNIKLFFSEKLENKIYHQPIDFASQNQILSAYQGKNRKNEEKKELKNS